MRVLAFGMLLALGATGVAFGKEAPLTGRVCGVSACRPVDTDTAWRLVPWYGFGLDEPPQQSFFHVELNAGRQPAGRVVWAPRANLVWTDARPYAASAWTRPAPYVRTELERRTRGLRPYPPSAGWRPAPRTAPVTVVKACGLNGCHGVGEAGDAGRRARARVVQASPVGPTPGPWHWLVVRQRGRNGFVWSLRYSPARKAVLIDRKDPAPPFWVSAPPELLPLIARAAAGLRPYGST